MFPDIMTCGSILDGLDSRDELDESALRDFDVKDPY